MLKLNNKGFTLAETLVTVVFVMVIFSTIYANYVPLMAEYEKRETYDDIDGVYAAYWMKKLVESDDFPAAYRANCNNMEVICDNFNKYKKLCDDYVVAANIEHVYLRGFSIAHNDPNIPSMQEYVNYLPVTSDDTSKCRIYVEMKRKINAEMTANDDVETVTEYYAYSNIEVNK